jgi:hypothetical protein
MSFCRKGRKERKDFGVHSPEFFFAIFASWMRAIPGAPPAGALRTSNFVPDKIVRQMII